jgi:hypothetical protein
MMPRRSKLFVVRFSPDVGPTAQPLERLKRELIIRQHTEGWDNVFFKIFVLVIAPDEDKVRLEGVDLLADLTEGLEYPCPVSFM